MSIFHNYKACKVINCEDCDYLVNNGFVISCDNCYEPGDSESEGWIRTNDERTVCIHCEEQSDEDHTTI